MNNPTSMRIRVSRFLEERYRLRDTSGYFAELFLWGAIIVIVTWPLFTVINAMTFIR
jgi:hypothetical protein